MHRIGRTARAGTSGVAISFCDATEQGTLRAIERMTGTALYVAGGSPPARAANGPGHGRTVGPATVGRYAPASRPPTPAGGGAEAACAARPEPLKLELFPGSNCEVINPRPGNEAVTGPAPSSAINLPAVCYCASGPTPSNYKGQ